MGWHIFDFRTESMQQFIHTYVIHWEEYCLQLHQTHTNAGEMQPWYAHIFLLEVAESPLVARVQY